jgi:predicted HicB family RNase H-like nuclease
MAGPEIDEPTEGVATFAPGQDNVEAAMHDLAEGMDLTVSTRVSDDDGPADKQILIRATEHDRERWKRAAQVAEVSLSALIRETMNRKVADILDCSHPMEFRVSYPWAEHCKKCGSRLRG